MGKTAASTLPTIHCASIRELLAYAQARGLDPVALQQEVGLRRSEVRSPNGRVALSLYYDLVEQCCAALGDPEMGVHFAEVSTMDDFDLVTYLWLTAGTLRQSLETMLRFQRLWTDGEQMRLLVDGNNARLCFVHWGPPRPAHRLLSVHYLAMTVRAIALLGFDWQLSAGELAHPTGKDVARLASVLRAPVYCDRPMTAAVFPARLLDARMPAANKLLHGELIRQAHDLLQQLPSNLDTIGQITAVISERLGERSVSLARVAALLGRSTRSVQRDLSGYGTTFRQVLQRVRRSHAERLLRSGLSIAEVAARLGYSQTSAFSRAFQGWTGTSPSTYQRHEH